MIKDWIVEIRYLSEIVKTYPHSAYSAFVHGLQNRHTYTMRTIPDLSEHLQSLEDAIRNCFIKTLVIFAMIQCIFCFHYQRNLVDLEYSYQLNDLELNTKILDISQPT